MDLQNILASDFVTRIILPFVLVFTLIFAILEKTKILGDDKKQINAILAFVTGLIVISFRQATDVIVNIMPVMAIIAVALLLFLMLYFFSSGQAKDFSMNSGLKTVLGVIVGGVLLIALAYFSGAWSYISGLSSSGGGVLKAIIFVAIIVGAVIFVLKSAEKKGG